MKRGGPKRQNDEYVRNGTCYIFLFTEALGSWRYANAIEHRTKIDWLNQVRRLLEVEYPECKKVRLVMDNLNTYSISSLYEAFPPEITRSLAVRIEIHYTQT